HDAVLLAFVDGIAGTGRQAGGIGAVVAQARQVEIVAVGVVTLALVLVPVGAPGGLHVGTQPGIGAGHQRLFVVVLPRHPVVVLAGLTPQAQGAVGIEAA